MSETIDNPVIGSVTAFEVALSSRQLQNSFGKLATAIDEYNTEVGKLVEFIVDESTAVKREIYDAVNAMLESGEVPFVVLCAPTGRELEAFEKPSPVEKPSRLDRSPDMIDFNEAENLRLLDAMNDEVVNRLIGGLCGKGAGDQRGRIAEAIFRDHDAIMREARRQERIETTAEQVASQSVKGHKATDSTFSQDLEDCALIVGEAQDKNGEIVHRENDTVITVASLRQRVRPAKLREISRRLQRQGELDVERD